MQFVMVSFVNVVQKKERALCQVDICVMPARLWEYNAPYSIHSQKSLTAGSTINGAERQTGHKTIAYLPVFSQRKPCSLGERLLRNRRPRSAPFPPPSLTFLSNHFPLLLPVHVAYLRRERSTVAAAVTAACSTCI